MGTDELSELQKKRVELTTRLQAVMCRLGSKDVKGRERRMWIDIHDSILKELVKVKIDLVKVRKQKQRVPNTDFLRVIYEQNKNE